MDNMISGTTTAKSTVKKPTSFSLDPELLIQFKAGCVHLGRPMSIGVFISAGCVPFWGTVKGFFVAIILVV